ncbi:MAG: cation:dicarboxylase symporter family transporter [Planctomycetota bacterium]|nr:cation:dicarboxylase symporter family transporter [Planctomycetota bacterium]
MVDLVCKQLNTSKSGVGRNRAVSQILVGMLAVGALGAAGQAFAPTTALAMLNEQVMDPIGKLFIQAIKFIVVPLVVTSVVIGITSLGDIRRIGRVGAKTLGYYFFTLVSALLLAFATGLAFKPGAGLTPDLKGKPCGGAWEGVVQALAGCIMWRRMRA